MRKLGMSVELEWVKMWDGYLLKKRNDAMGSHKDYTDAAQG